MKQILTICRYTFMDGLRKKSFLVSTVILLFLIVGLCMAASVMGTEEDNSAVAAEEMGTCYYIDETGTMPTGAEALKAAYPGYEVVIETADKKEALRAGIAEDKKQTMVCVEGSESGLPAIQVTTKDFMSGMDPEGITGVLTKTYIEKCLKDQGVAEDTAALARIQLEYSAEAAGEMNLSGYALGAALTILMFFAIYFYGYWVAMSVALEKTSRVMESLIIAAKPSRILIGKCLGMGLLGLLQFGGLLGVGILSYLALVPKNLSLFGAALSFEAFTPGAAVLLVVYFILGYTLYAVMNSVCGAMVAKVEDLNSAMMPVMLVVMVSFYLAYFTAISGTGALIQKIVIYLPFTSPFAIPFRVLNSTVSGPDLLISIALLLVFIAVITWFSVRMYSASVLHYGKKLKLKDMK